MLALKNTCSSLKVVVVGGWGLLYRIFVSGVEYLVFVGWAQLCYSQLQIQVLVQPFQTRDSGLKGQM